MAVKENLVLLPRALRQTKVQTEILSRAIWVWAGWFNRLAHFPSDGSVFLANLLGSAKHCDPSESDGARQREIRLIGKEKEAGNRVMSVQVTRRT